MEMIFYKEKSCTIIQYTANNLKKQYHSVFLIRTNKQTRTKIHLKKF